MNPTAMDYARPIPNVLKLAALLLALAAGSAIPTAPAEAMTFSPPTFDFIVEPGQSITDSVKLRNDSTDPARVTATVVNFRATPGDETEGTPEFYPASDPGDGHGLAGWMQVLNPAQALEPGGSGVVLFQIDVPADASPGSYFGAVVVRTEAVEETSAGVGVVADTALLVLLRVQGEAVEDLKLASFTAEGVVASLPVGFEARVENAGTVHLRPYGEITVVDMFGRVVAVVPINRQEYKSVLPGNARRYMSVWTKEGLDEDDGFLVRQWKGFALGRYTASLKLTYGAGDDKALVAAQSFWVVPWATILMALAAAAAAWALIRSVLQSWRKAIIRQHDREKGTGTGT